MPVFWQADRRVERLTKWCLICQQLSSRMSVYAFTVSRGRNGICRKSSGPPCDVEAELLRRAAIKWCIRRLEIAYGNRLQAQAEQLEIGLAINTGGRLPRRGQYRRSGHLRSCGWITAYPSIGRASRGSATKSTGRNGLDCRLSSFGAQWTA